MASPPTDGSDTLPGATGAAGRRSRWWTVGWAAALLLTALNGVVVGYGAVWFQLFGATADAEDYRVSAGGYFAAAAVLALGTAALLGRPAGPRWLVWAAGTTAVVLAVLGLDSQQQSTRAEQLGTPLNGVWDGVGGVLWAPWTWVLTFLGVRAVVRALRLRGRSVPPDGTDRRH